MVYRPLACNNSMNFKRHTADVLQVSDLQLPPGDCLEGASSAAVGYRMSVRKSAILDSIVIE